MKPIRLLLKLHKRNEKLKKFKKWCDTKLKQNKEEIKRIVFALPDEELLKYGELMGYMKER